MLNVLRTLTFAYSLAKIIWHKACYSNVLNISCDFLSTVLKVKTKWFWAWLFALMITWLTGSCAFRNCPVLNHISLAWEKIKIWAAGFYECCHFHSIIMKILCWTIVGLGRSVLWKRQVYFKLTTIGDFYFSCRRIIWISEATCCSISQINGQVFWIPVHHLCTYRCIWYLFWNYFMRC